MPRVTGCPRNLALILCLITDRHRLVTTLARRLDAWQSALLVQVEGAIAGGVDFVQIREGGLESREYAAFVRQCVARTTGTATRVLVNDRVDIAVVAGAHGVHLRESSICIAAARRLAPTEFVVGRSVHDVETARRSRAADYLMAGSVFATVSKPGVPASLGLDGLRNVVSAAGDCPVWAVGGITAAYAADVASCGAQGLAAIGAFIPSTPTSNLAGAVEGLTRALRRAAIDARVH